jgi:hypothetical protein
MGASAVAPRTSDPRGHSRGGTYTRELPERVHLHLDAAAIPSRREPPCPLARCSVGVRARATPPSSGARKPSRLPPFPSTRLRRPRSITTCTGDRRRAPAAAPQLPTVRHHAEIVRCHEARGARAVVALGGSHAHGVLHGDVRRRARRCAGQDAVEFRRGSLRNHPRHTAVLELAAAKGRWGSRWSRGRGEASRSTSHSGSFVAEAAEVTLQSDGTIKVDRVVCAVDCGRVVNPDIVRAQREGGIRLRALRRPPRRDYGCGVSRSTRASSGPRASRRIWRGHHRTVARTSAGAYNPRRSGPCRAADPG